MHNGSVEPKVNVPSTQTRTAYPWDHVSWSFLPFVMLLVGLGLSGWMFWFLREENVRADRVHFEHLIRAAEGDISQGITVCSNALRASQAFFNATPAMTKDRWKAFAATQDMANRYPGIKGLGVVFAVSSENLASFESEVRADGRSDFTVREIPGMAPLAGHGPDYPWYIITYMEPEAAIDAPLFGMNIAGEVNRCEAMEKARDTAGAVLTSQIYLLTDKARRSALALYEPFYRAGLPISTVEQRRQAIRGWIYARLVMEDFLGSILSGTEYKELNLSFYTGDSAAAENLVYASDSRPGERKTFERLDKLVLAGRTFTLGWSPSPYFISSRTSAPVLVCIFSALVAIFLASLVAGLLSSRKRAKETLAQQDRELAYQKFALDQHAIVAVTDARGTITYANDKFCEVSGYSREELIGRNHRIIKSGVHPPEFFKQMYATITSGKVWRGEICNRRKNGELNWASATIVPFLGLDGRPEKYVAIRTDITERRRAEEFAAERERLIRTVTDGLPGMVAYWTAELRCTFANHAYREWFGRDPETMIGMRMIDLLGEELFRKNEPYVRGVLKGEPQAFERTLIKANGETGYTWAQYVPDIGPDGTTVKGFYVLISDVTEVKNKTEALREAAQRLQLAAAITQIGVWEWNLAENKVQADDRMFEIYGLPRAPDGCFLPEIWRTVVLAEDLPTQMAHLSQTIESCGRSWRQFRIRRPSDGAIRYIESEEQVQTDHAGKAVRVIGVNRDITDSVQAEIALLESETRTRLFAEHAPASVAMFDREMRYLVVSKQWLTEFKLDGKSIIGRSHYEVFPETSERWKEIHNRCLGGAIEISLSDSYTLPDGSSQWLQWEVRPWRTTEGEIGGIVMFTLDITGRRELEISLEKARDDALAASRLKSEFLATMSHEIRTPMNGVIGMASLLAQTPLESRQREMTQALANSAERLMVIINDILDFSKIEAGKMRIEPVEFDLRDLLEETATLMAAPAHRKGLHLISDIDPVLATGFLGDSGRIQQILSNLIGNAVKFTHRGEISITANALSMTDKIGTFRISITDTGIGIPESAKERLFQPFVQADGSTTRRFGGTGLGLAISQQLISLMGGNIGFTSTEGKGSRFWIELGLPRVELPKVEFSDKIPSEARVLVVDDHEVNRMVLLRQLATLQVPVEAVSNAKEALAILESEADRKKPFSIVLLDWSMPEIDGLGLAQAIRANHKIANTCLIVLSSTIETIEPSVLAGLKFHAVLTKPVRENQLHRCLLRVYGRRATPTPFERRQTLAGRGLKLLLAEDNETNQLVAKMTLEQLGHTITIAENGRVALERLAAEPFDAILMDCQMPEMDGYEATRQIRLGKVHGINPHIPIIALTAFAMPSDRARVLEAGMDDFVSKPLSKETLHAAFARCGLIEEGQKGRTLKSASRAAVAGPTGDNGQVFDPTQRGKLQALKTPGGGTVWDKVVSIFINEMPARLEALHKHAAEKNAEQLGVVAHTLAGSAAIVGGLALRAASRTLEAAAKGFEWDKVPACLETLLGAWRQLEPELSKTTKK